MRSTTKTSSRWKQIFAVKVLGWITALDLIALPILWSLKILHLLTLILLYEALFIMALGFIQILGSYIYREDSIPPSVSPSGGFHGGSRTGWFDLKRFARLKPEERKRYRQEGLIMVTTGLTLLLIIVIAHFTHALVI